MIQGLFGLLKMNKTENKENKSQKKRSYYVVCSNSSAIKSCLLRWWIVSHATGQFIGITKNLGIDIRRADSLETTKFEKEKEKDDAVLT